ncbi:hypothetical protein M436DRAFT_78857 [Aureobasidium namibiae CBS 147.97]|uniref:Uncharacterized protein n=1 Tax=Aureobasidium namibiae CBS 147.97 TaxID=1043004 RepID=A0A074WVC3_9PEZI
MPPVSTAPRELLWYHQIQRETRHLLEQISKQQADLDKLKNQSSTDQKQREQSQQLLLELETKQATALERRREDFEREKEILKRIGKLEESVEALRRANESQSMVTGAASQWHTLERRLDILEQNQAKSLQQDVQRLNLRIDALAKEMKNSIKDPNTFAKQRSDPSNDKGSAAEAEKNAGTANAGDKVRGATDSEELQAEREISSQRPSDFVQKKRRPGEKHIPFRPTPPELSW